MASEVDMSHPLGKFPTWQYIYSRLDVGAQMSQINLFRALPQDSRQPSVTIPKDAFVKMAVKSKTFTTSSCMDD